MTNYLKLHLAANCFRNGGIIAYPTEAVFGIGCDPLNWYAVQKLLFIKKRSIKKGLILIAAYFEQIKPFIKVLSKCEYSKINSTWPGPYTWLLPASSKTPIWLKGQHTTLAVRITAHPVASALCNACDSPLVSTSANISHRPPARSILAVRKTFGKEIDFLLGGATNQQRPTEIRDLKTGVVIRSS